MYNRYVPQSDGSYKRNRMEEPIQPSPVRSQPPPPPEEPDAPCCREAPKCQNRQNCPHAGTTRPHPQKQSAAPDPVGLGAFFKGLLPKTLDTEDLLVVILLLLMAGDCREDQNYALMTLVIYLFL